jgi:hypothetical protein
LLRQPPEGWVVLPLERAGRSILTLDIAIPLASSTGTDSITLPASPSPISRTTLVLPKSGVKLSLSGGFLADHTEAANESRWIVFGRPNQPLSRRARRGSKAKGRGR